MSNTKVEKKAINFDLANIDPTSLADEGVEMEITHPSTGEGIGMFILLCGSDSDRYRNAERKILNKRLSNPSAKQSVERLEESSLKLLIGCTLGFRNLVLNGKSYEYNQDNIRKLYINHRWIKEQVDAFIADRGNYLKN